MAEYESVVWTPQTPVCYETFAQMSANIDYLKNLIDNAGHGFVQKVDLTSSVSRSSASFGTVGTVSGVTTEAGRQYRLSAYCPKVQNPGRANSGASVRFRLIDGSGDNIFQSSFVYTGPIYRWGSMYIEAYITPGAVTKNYKLQYAPLFGVGTASVTFSVPEASVGYIVMEDVGPAV